jgi:hypothetical protein
VSVVLAWVVFPSVAVAVALGWGLLTELAAGRPLPGVLLAPLGLAAIVVVSQLLTASDATAELATPVVTAGGAAGLAVARRRLRAASLDRWAVAAATAVFLVYAAPVVLSGSATFAGYGQLGDIADQFVIVDSMMDTGGSVADPSASAFDRAVAAYPEQGYPTGMHTALGALRPLVGQDVAWVYQPFLALVMALAALALLPLLVPVLASRRARAVAVTAAALPALTFGYALQGSIKELGAVWVLALLGGLLPWYAAAVPGPRRVVPLVLAAGAGAGVLGAAIAPWLGPLALVCLYLAARRGGRWQALPAGLEAVAFAAGAAVLSLPTLTGLGTYADVVVDVVTRGSELGNLLHPLSVWQALSAWPSWDFRLDPDTVPRWIAVGASGMAVALGVAAVLRRPARHWALLAWLGAVAIGWAYVTGRGSPWADAKVLAITAPAVALTAAVGVLTLVERGMRLEGAAMTALLAGAMLWSVGLEARGASLAPRGRLDELAELAPTLRGPTLLPQFEPFAKHFLRDAAPDSLTEPYPGFTGPALRAGVEGRPLGSSFDVDDLAPRYVGRFRTIVLRRGPGSRPPALYRRVWRGRWYEAWTRAPGAQRRWIGSVAAGSASSPAGRPDCSQVRRLARFALRTRARIVAYPRAAPVVWTPANVSPLPSAWGVDPGDPQTLVAPRPGEVSGAVAVPRAGEYDVWLASSLGAEVTVSIDGRDVGRVRGGIQPRGQVLPLDRVRLAAGRHAIAVRRGGHGLRPGAEGGSRLIGPVTLEVAGALDRPLLAVSPRRADVLCRRSVDWVEAVRP